MHTQEDATVYYALFGATPPTVLDRQMNAYISQRIDDTEQECILEHAERDRPIGAWLEEAANFFNGANIYYRRSKWTPSSRLIKIDTSHGFDSWLYEYADEQLKKTNPKKQKKRINYANYAYATKIK